MSEREPALLRDETDGSVADEAAEPTEPTRAPVVQREVDVPARPAGRGVPTVHVVGFWKRLVAGVIDLAIVAPASLLVTLLASKLAGVHLPPSNLGLLDIDQWVDLVLATDPALVMGFGLGTAIGMTYLLVMHIVVGRTLGMRVMKMRIIDVYGDRPSPARSAARCAGYLASAATLFLGFLWIGFDSEKRALQDWIAGTYVIRA